MNIRFLKRTEKTFRELLLVKGTELNKNVKYPTEIKCEFTDEEIETIEELHKLVWDGIDKLMALVDVGASRHFHKGIKELEPFLKSENDK